jgi:hypothetical protein
MGKTLNGGYKITANIWTKTINGDTANSTGLSKRQIWNKNEELNQQVWRSTLKKNMDSSQTQRDCNGTRMETQEKKYVKFDYDLANTQTPCLGRLPSRSNQLSRTYVVQVSNIRRRVLHVSDASSRPTTKHLWPSKCVVQGKSIYAKYSI